MATGVALTPSGTAAASALDAWPNYNKGALIAAFDAAEIANGAFPLLGNRVFGVGDSIMALGYTPANGMPYAAVGPGAFMMWASLLSQGRLIFGGVSGTGGFPTSSVLNVHIPVAIAAKPAACLVLAGGNDLAGAAAGTVAGIVAAAAANLAQCYQLLANAGIVPVACTYNPRMAVSATETKGLNALNAWITRYATRHGIPLVDFHNALVNPATGDYITGLNLDNTHPNSAGAKKMGQLVSDVLAGTNYLTLRPQTPWLPPALSWLPGNNVDTANLYTNGLMQTDSGAPAGRPAGWSVSSGAPSAESLITDASVLGKYYSMTGIAAMQIFAAGSTAVAGDLVQMCCRVATVVEASAGNATISFCDSGGTVNYMSLGGWDKDIPLGSVLSYEFVMPSAGNQRMRTIIQGAVNAGANVKVGQVAALNLTALGAALSA